MIKKIIASVVGIIVVAGGVFIFNKKSDTADTSEVIIPHVATSTPATTTSVIKPTPAPPTSVSQAEKDKLVLQINEQFDKNWRGEVDGCGYGSLSKIRNAVRITGGYKVDIDYYCGFIAQGTPPSQTTVYVYDSGEITGVPSPDTN